MNQILRKILIIVLSISLLLITFNLFFGAQSISSKSIKWSNCNDFRYSGQPIKCEFGLVDNTNMGQISKEFFINLLDSDLTVLSKSDCELEIKNKLVICDNISTSNVKSNISTIRLILGEELIMETTIGTVTSIKKGINITKWFRYSDGLPNSYLNYISDIDLQKIKSLGYDHIRLPIDVVSFYNNSKMYDFLGTAITKITNNGFAVIIDAHSQDLNKDLESSKPSREKYKQFWEKLANFTNNYDSYKVFLELYNEPIFYNETKQWSDYQIELYNAVRSIAKNNTIILTTNRYSNFSNLSEIEKPKDKNIIYTFHYYGDNTYSHQGVDFSDDYLEDIIGLEYPYNEVNCNKVLEATTNPKAKEFVSQYCQSKFDINDTKKRFEQFVKPLLDDGYKIMIGEYGSFSCQKNVTDTEVKQLLRNSKIKFIQDTQSVMKSYDIPTTLWGFDDCFGLNARKVNGVFEYDQQILDAITKK